MNELLYRAHYEISNHMTWDQWEYTHSTETIPGLGQVRIVERKEDERERDNYYSEFPQGSEGQIGMTFEVTTDGGEVVHLHKEGTSDSYGTESWNGKFYGVKPIEKRVTRFERI